MQQRAGSPVPKYDVMVDGERMVRVKSDDEVRTWLANYREEHQEDDPEATHVQIVHLRFAGGSLVPRERFF
jgi:hypothetical protein